MSIALSSPERCEDAKGNELLDPGETSKSIIQEAAKGPLFRKSEGP